MKNTLWVARDKDDSLWLFHAKPRKSTDGTEWLSDVSFAIPVSNTKHREVTFETSPQQVELTLIPKVDPG